MKSAGLFFAAVVMMMPACQSPERAAIQPIPEDSPPLTYQDLLYRAKTQVSAAEEFLFRDSWSELQQAGAALQDTTARIVDLPADQLPDEVKTALARPIEEINQGATSLQAAGKDKNVPRASEALQRLRLALRGLRIPEREGKSSTPEQP